MYKKCKFKRKKFLFSTSKGASGAGGGGGLTCGFVEASCYEMHSPISPGLVTIIRLLFSYRYTKLQEVSLNRNQLIHLHDDSNSKDEAYSYLCYFFQILGSMLVFAY